MLNGEQADPRNLVLVVEDDPILRMITVHVVEEAGLEAIEAGSADEAVVILEARNDIRIVFTDIDMPGSMNGLTMSIAIRDRWPPIELIIVSGKHLAKDVTMPARAVFFAKPYDINEVIAELQRLVAQPDPVALPIA